MARVKKAINAKKKHKKILKLAKGYYGAKSKQFRPANEAVMRALRSAYSGRKQKKRDYRKLWISRINAAARINDISYSRLMHGLKLADVQIDRKILAELAVADMTAFTQLVDVAKSKLN
ncbi:50S ribosomal protein L20 [Alkalibacter saccharofermentans]|jgi:large subunit ribosomal protein L20|uniref:Large ribosomal subunit protein bL20 n=1 Tax=Alkalibacter saccharofermentans DSM 14828 TaxID=1120975 RepID=A0A1M4UDX4_9FIRM|nr:50S ribosomal protein L20 [Alkalibacter saccharofermentans]SHE54773.1 LSU ribosomal protein L20P [Alkalibacter saccharofermentans DSM 14828]